MTILSGHDRTISSGMLSVKEGHTVWQTQPTNQVFDVEIDETEEELEAMEQEKAAFFEKRAFLEPLFSSLGYV